MKWNDVIPEIMTDVPGCPEPLVEAKVRNAAILFCRESRAWKERLEDIYPVEGQVYYQLELPEEAQLSILASARQYPYTNPERYNELGARMTNLGTLQFDQAPVVADGPIEVMAILQPTKDATGMPDRLGQIYERALIHGALGRLFEMPGRDWSSPSFAEYHWKQFRDVVADAKVRAATGETNEPIRVSPDPTMKI